MSTILKGTVSVILRDPSCKNGKVRLTNVPLKALCDQVWIRYQCLKFWYWLLTSTQVTCIFLLQEIIWKLSELNTLHWGFLEIILAVSVRTNLLKKVFKNKIIDEYLHLDERMNEFMNYEINELMNEYCSGAGLAVSDSTPPLGWA